MQVSTQYKEIKQYIAGIYAARGLESPPVNYAEKTTQTDLFQPLANVSIYYFIDQPGIKQAFLNGYI